MSEQTTVEQSERHCGDETDHDAHNWADDETVWCIGVDPRRRQWLCPNCQTELPHAQQLLDEARAEGIAAVRRAVEGDAMDWTGLGGPEAVLEIIDRQGQPELTTSQ